MYLLCCILHIVKTKDLASSIATTLFCLQECFIPKSEVKPNGCTSNLDVEYQYKDYSIDVNGSKGSKRPEMKYSNSSSILSPDCSLVQRCKVSQISLRYVEECHANFFCAMVSVFLLFTLNTKLCHCWSFPVSTLIWLVSSLICWGLPTLICRSPPSSNSDLGQFHA